VSDNEIIRVMSASQTAQRRGIKNIPTRAQAKAMVKIYRDIFEKVKAAEPSAVVSSGFRSEALNRAVKGAKTSQHTYPVNHLGVCVAGAIDIDSKLNPRKLSTVVRAVVEANGVNWDQLIIEFPPNGWVHVSMRFDGVKGRRQTLTIGGK